VASPLYSSLVFLRTFGSVRTLAGSAVGGLVLISLLFCAEPYGRPIVTNSKLTVGFHFDWTCSVFLAPNRINGQREPPMWE